MTRSIRAYKGGYRLDGAGTTDLDRLLGNFGPLLDHVAADQSGAHTESSGDWIDRGAQRTDVSLCTRTTGARAGFLSADGVAAGLAVPANVTWLCEAHVLAVMDYGYTSAWVLRFVVQNNGIAAHLAGTIASEALAEECGEASVDVSTDGDRLHIVVRNSTEPDRQCGTSWHADLHLTELGTVPKGSGSSGGAGSGGTVI